MAANPGLKAKPRWGMRAPTANACGAKGIHFAGGGCTEYSTIFHSPSIRIQRHGLLAYSVSLSVAEAVFPKAPGAESVSPGPAVAVAVVVSVPLAPGTTKPVIV